MRTRLCVCPPKVESLFPPVLLKSCNQIPVAFKVWFSRNSSSHSRSPRFGSLTWGSEPSLQWVNFCGISVLQSVSNPPSSYGTWFYCDCTSPAVSLWLLLCPWMWDIFFGEFQCLPVDDCPAASCDPGVLARGSESTSFYSAILVPIWDDVILPEWFQYRRKLIRRKCSKMLWVIVLVRMVELRIIYYLLLSFWLEDSPNSRGAGL